MPDDQRVYSDEEFALILRKATELGNRAEESAGAAGGLTLAEMKAAAQQVGIDPALVDRAARMIVATATATPLERLIGGPVRHHHEVRFPTTLDEDQAAQLLSAIRISAGLAGKTDGGHSSSMGMTWHDGGNVDALKVAARAEEDGTAVSVDLDRRGTLALVAGATGVVMFLSLLFAAFALYPESPAQGYGGLVAGVGGALAIARGYWASSTRRVQERISVVMDTLGRTLTQPEEAQGSERHTIGDGAEDRRPDANDVTDA